MLSAAELMRALPEYEETFDEERPAARSLADVSMRPVPVGRLRRLGVLGTLQAKIAAAYLFYWIRGWFKNADEKEQLLAETHWRTAARVIDSMSYLRGATIKAGQFLGSFPDIMPDEFVETLEQLHFNAPPMHWSLLREMVYSELGDDPENVFASFDTRAFAAASLGQVHRSRLKTGEEVAVKIQYPGIARSIAEDFRNLAVFMLPGRLGADWENTREQFDDIRSRLECETDYRREAATMETMRSLFRDDEGIVIPRVFPQYSTQRVLTMQRLEGVHLDQFLAMDPPQELRNEYGRKILRSWYRMLHAGRTVYADCNPGNFIFMDDDRLGLIDFGCMVELDERLWELFHKMDRPITTGDAEGRRELIKDWSGLGDDPTNQDRLRVMDEFLEWIWRPRSCGREFDFGNEADLRRGIDLAARAFRKRYTRGHPTSPMMTRQQFALLAMLHRLKANVDVSAIAEEEVRAAGWDRSEYAPR